MINVTPATIFEYRDRQVAVRDGYLTFRLYADGWLVRFTPFQGKTQTEEGLDVWTACRFANESGGVK